MTTYPRSSDRRCLAIAFSHRSPASFGPRSRLAYVQATAGVTRRVVTRRAAAGPLDAGQLRVFLSHPEDVVNLIGALSPAKAVQAFVLDAILSNIWSRDQFLKAVKPVKFNLGKVEQAMKAKPAPTKKAAKKR